jgi:enoyl-CoA hydratase
MTATPRYLDVSHRGQVATVRVDRPPANAVNPELIADLLAVLPGMVADPDVRALVIRGTGRFFFAGADIAAMRDLSALNQRKMRGWIDVARMLETAPKPVVAAMNGHALGGGAELALACDLRILAGSATFGFPEMSLGIFPGAGGSQRLPRLVGPHRAMRMMIDGTRFDAPEALRLGLVDEVIDDDDFDAEVERIAGALAAKPTRSIGLLKRAVDRGAGLPIDEALRMEEAAVAELMGTEDAAEGLQAFLDKRRPVFRGR